MYTNLGVLYIPGGPCLLSFQMPLFVFGNNFCFNVHTDFY